MATQVARPDMVISHLESYQHGAMFASTHRGSLVFHCEVDDATPASKTAKSESYLQAAKDRIHYFCKPCHSGFPAKLLRDVRSFKRILSKEENQVDAVLLAAKLSSVGYDVVVRYSLGGAATNSAPGSCFRNLRHEFLHVRCKSGDYEGVEFIVDVSFRDQFTIPHPTEHYKRLLDSVPEEFVGTTARLIPVVQLLCNEMAASFESRHLTLPPWRKTQSMLSKWMPAKSRDVAVSSSQSGPSVPCDSTTSQGGSNPSSSSGHAVNKDGSDGLRSQKSLLSQRLQNSPSPSRSASITVNPPAHWSQPAIHTIRLTGFSAVNQ